MNEETLSKLNMGAKILEGAAAAGVFIGYLIMVINFIAIINDPWNAGLGALLAINNAFNFARVCVFIAFFLAIAVAVLSGMSRRPMGGSITGIIFMLIVLILQFMFGTGSSLEGIGFGAIVIVALSLILSLIVAIMSLVGAFKKNAYAPNTGYPQNSNQQFTPNQGYPQNANQQFNPNQGYPQNNNPQNPAGGFYQNNGKM